VSKKVAFSDEMSGSVRFVRAMSGQNVRLFYPRSNRVPGHYPDILLMRVKLSTASVVRFGDMQPEGDKNIKRDRFLDRWGWCAECVSQKSTRK
jgi:hypothetical protein